MVKSSLGFFFEIPPCRNMIISCTKFVVLGKNLLFFEVRENSFLQGGISKEMTLDRTLFTTIHILTEDGSTEALLQILYGQYLILGVFGSYMF
jgi:hypothetical protein